MSPLLRRWLSTIAGTVGVAGSLVTAQMIVQEQGWRLDLTPERRHVLSDHARTILAGLRHDVEIVAFQRPEDPRNPEMEDLLRRVSLASPRVRSRSVDVNRNPALARRYGVDAYGAVVVESEGRRRVFSNASEDLLVAAIVLVTRPDHRRVYFLSGHGEREFRDPGDRQGLTVARVALITEGYEVDELAPRTEAAIPEDADVVVLAGPRHDLLPGELLQIESYLRRGGGLLALLDGKPPGLTSLLGRLGVAVSDEIVVDPENRLFAGDFLTLLVPERSPAHPVSLGVGAPALMSQVRPVFLSAAAAGGAELVATAASSWRTPDTSVLRTGTATFRAGQDTAGPVPVGVAVERPGETGRPGRVVVFGDSDFASNAFLGYLGNRDLLLNSVNWLAGDEAQIGSRPPDKVPGVEQFFVTEAQGRTAFWLGTVAQPALLLLLGGWVVAWRRRYG